MGMDTEKKHRRVFFHIYTKEGYKGRWVYSQRHMRFSESDVPDLFTRRPYQDQEQHTPDYLYHIAEDGIHIALLYDGLPKGEPGESEGGPV